MSQKAKIENSADSESDDWGKTCETIIYMKRESLELLGTSEGLSLF